MNSRVILALAVSAGMALLVTGVVYQLALSGGSSQKEEVAMTEVVVAAKDLDIGAGIQPTDLRLEAWPKNKLAADTFTEIEQVIDRTPTSGVLAGEPVLGRRLAPPGSGVGLSTKVPAGMRAMSVRVDDVIGVAGFVLPEARVDVLITGVPRNRPDGGHITKTILGNVRVLSAGEHLAPDASGRAQKVQVVTLLLEPEQAEMVTLAQTQGRIQLVLRNNKDDEVAGTAGVRESDLYGGPARTINVSAPKPAPPPLTFEAPLPPPVHVETIRGNRRSVEAFGAAEELD
jgi:pilus assembly protein CpaB